MPRLRSILIAAHRALERLVLTRDELRFKALTDRRYAELIYDGLWMQPLRGALDAFNAALRVAYDRRGALALASRQLRRHRRRARRSRSTTSSSRPTARRDAFDHRAASGFIALHALPLEAFARAAQTRERDPRQ